MLENVLIYKQADLYYRSLSLEEQNAMIHILVENIMFLKEETQEKVLLQLSQVNQELYDKVKEKLQ